MLVLPSVRRRGMPGNPQFQETSPRCTIKKVRWELDAESFRALLRKFDEEVDRAAEKYELIRSRLIKFFESRRCNLAVELTDETINRVSRRISEGETIPQQSLSGYFYGVARNVWKEYLNSPDQVTCSIESLEAKRHPSENLAEKDHLRSERAVLEQMLDCLESCVKELPAMDQELILVYYKGEAGAKIENRKTIARKFGLNLNNVRIRIFRIRARLEKCVESCRRKFTEE